MCVIGAGAAGLVQTRHGFQVVVQYLWRFGRENLQGQFQPPAKVWHQYLYLRCRRCGACGVHAIDEVLRAAVFQIVAIDTGDDHIFQAHGRQRLGQVARFFRVGRQGLAVADVAERAAPGAQVAQDHEGGGAVFEALAQVRAGGFLAHGMQFGVAQDGFELLHFRRARRLRLDPDRQFQARLGDDLDRDAGGFGRAFMAFGIGHCSTYVLGDIWAKVDISYRRLIPCVPPTVNYHRSVSIVGWPTPTGTLWPSLPQVPTPGSRRMSLPIMETRVSTSGRCRSGWRP
jgi:hypothetical protein